MKKKVGNNKYGKAAEKYDCYEISQRECNMYLTCEKCVCEHVRNEGELECKKDRKTEQI